MGHVLEALKTGFMLGSTTSKTGDFIRKWLEEVTDTIAICKCLCTIIGFHVLIRENVKVVHRAQEMRGVSATAFGWSGREQANETKTGLELKQLP